jgi:hypothetical protein
LIVVLLQLQLKVVEFVWVRDLAFDRVSPQSDLFSLQAKKNLDENRKVDLV